MQSISKQLYTLLLPLYRITSTHNPHRTTSYARHLSLLILVLVSLHKLVLPKLVQWVLSKTQIRIKSMRLSHFSPSNLTARIHADLLGLPFPAPKLHLGTRSHDIVLFSADYSKVAELHLNSPISITRASTSIALDAQLNVSVAFDDFCAMLVTCPDRIAFHINAHDMFIKVSWFYFNIYGLKLLKSVSVAGMDGLHDMHISSVDLVGSTTDSLELDCTCILNNPSPISIHLGPVHFQLRAPDSDLQLGIVTIANLDLHPGPNPVTARSSMYKPSRESPANEIIANYLTNTPSKIVLSGLRSPVAYMDKAVQSIRIHTDLPPLDRPRSNLIESTVLHISKFNYFTNSIPTIITMQNPFPTSMTVTRIFDSSVVIRDSSNASIELGSISLANDGIIHVTGNSSFECDDLVRMHLIVGVSQLRAIYDSRANSGGEFLFVNVALSLDCRIGLCTLTNVKYFQNRVPVLLSF